jgi:superfamily II DNA/RNA helicase
MTFDDLGLSPKVLSAVHAAGFTTPTDIQAGAIPPALERKDVLGLAQTGSGKTAAFTLPMLTMLEKGRARARMPRSLILEPTRELAAQVHEAFTTLGKEHKLTIALLIGGVSFAEQNANIDRGADVLIATPGRLLDHIERGKLMLHGIEILVIDEADRMLDMGFIPDIERLCKLLPITRQTLFFSATMPPEIQRITNQFLHNPAQIEASARSSTAESIVQRVVMAPDDDREKRDKLREVVRAEGEVTNAIIFANRKTTVATLEKSLLKHKFNAGALHGDMDQFSRLKTLDAFRAGEISYLIASDVAARGLDIPAVSHVFNYDVPVHSEDYVHRIGRTGRAGREGKAITLVKMEEIRAVKAIEELISKTIDWQGDEPTEDDIANARSSRGRGRRSGGKAAGGRSAGGRSAGGKSVDAKPKSHSKPAENVEHADEPVKAAKPKSEKPARQRANASEKSSERGSDPAGFTQSNMPAFLARPVERA